MDINFSEILAKGEFDKRDFKKSFEDGDDGSQRKGSRNKKQMYSKGFVAYQFPSIKDAFDELNDLRKNQNLDDFERTALANFNTKNWTKKFDDVILFGKEIRKHLVITRGKKGAISIFDNKVTESQALENLKILDLTGAGDLFAAGFLHGQINRFSEEECLKKGTEMASKVIQKIGARL